MNIQKKEPLAAAQSGVIFSETDKGKLIINNSAIKLEKHQLDSLLKKLPTTAKQARRFTSCVAGHPNAPTNKCNRAAASVNLSDLALKYNPKLKLGGYYLACRSPKTPIINGFGEPSGQVLWGLYPLRKAA